MKDVYKHYKKYIEKSRKQTQFLKENYSIDKMTSLIEEYTNRIKIVTNMPLQLPKLKKANKKTNEAPKLKLPKLTKING
jgi:ppGpp synthetase/RelA/SpoT-type nucleotidyltranferase